MAALNFLSGVTNDKGKRPKMPEKRTSAAITNITIGLSLVS